MPGLFQKWFTVILAVTFLVFLPPVAEGADSSRHVLIVSAHSDLPGVVDSAQPGTTILLKDGIYMLSRPLVFRSRDVRIGSESGNREKVILDGMKGAGHLKRQNCLNEIIAVRASQVTIADMSIRHARDHAIHIFPQNEGNIRKVVMRNIHVYDCGQQLIKVNSNGGTPLYWVDEGVLEDSLIEFIDTSIMQDMGHSFYTGGLDVHGGKDWVVRRNTFRNIQREAKLMEHAVHIWSKSRGTVIEQNRFIDCYRAVGLGMRTRANGLVRNYPDGKDNDPYFDHIDGVVRNNVIFNRKGVHLESGIELMNVIGLKVSHNTVVSLDQPFSSIEYRWPNTHVEIDNNIVSHTIKSRDGARATLTNNIEKAGASLFKDSTTGDLRLSADAVQAQGKGAQIE